jgi:hypothetical protein
MFVVFRRRSHESGGRGQKNFPNLQPWQEIPGPWSVRFDPQWFYPMDGLNGDQAKGLFVFDKLEDWATRPEPAVKYFSGTAVYRKVFDLAPRISSQQAADSRHSRILLDLGRVKETARVKLNGRDLGVVWCHPWQVEITGIVNPGQNKLEIEVANLWPNRLVGDGSLPPGQRRTQTNFPSEPNQALLSSGLLGPVRILILETAEAPAPRATSSYRHPRLDTDGKLADDDGTAYLIYTPITNRHSHSARRG